MKPKLLILAAGVALASFSLLAVPGSNSPQSQVLRGWLSDEQCAKGRAQSGVFTGTNPDCVTSKIDAKTMTIHADSLKFLEKGAAMCGAKPKKSALR